MSVRVSVVMPVYNVEAYVEEAIESIINQNFEDFELIVIDDASTDKTVQIIKEIPDPRIKLICNKVNEGLAKNLNKGIKISNGEYIVRMDGDDISLPDRISRQVRFMDENPHIGISGTWIKLFGYVSIINEYPLNNHSCRSRLLFGVPFAHPSVILRKEILVNNSLYYNSSLLQYGEDFDLWVRASEVTELANIPEVMLKYRTFTNDVKKEAEELRAKKGREIRECNLTKIGFALSSLDKKCLQIFAKKQKVREEDSPTLPEIEAFVLNLERHVNKVGYCDSNELKKVLGNYWFLLCYNQQKISSIKTYFSSWLKYYYTPPFRLQIKFLVKQLFKL